MRKLSTFSFSLYLLVTILTTLLVLTLKNQATKASTLSPLPESLTIFTNNQVSSVNLWLPNVEKYEGNIKKPNISAKSVLVYDLSTNKTLFQKNTREKLPMASLTKIMTAIVALENKKETDKYIVSKDALVGENAMGLKEFEVLSLSELLYGLILHSGNDSAETLALNFANGREGFIKAMNAKAKTLGLKDTNFTNPSGLEGDGSQYTTAYDLLVMTNFALSNFSLFQDVVKSVEYYIPQTQTHKEYYLTNETNLLTSYPGVKGVKLGYTPEAGYSIVTYLEYDGHKIIGILLNSANRRQEMKDLLDYGLEVQGIKPPNHL